MTQHCHYIKNQHLILSTLKNLLSEDKIIILSSHNPNHALYLDSKVEIINKGQIIKVDSASTMKEVSKLRQIYEDFLSTSKDVKYDEISFKD